IPARAARPCAPSPPSRNLPAKTTSTPARRCCILYSWAEPPHFVLVLAGTQFNLSEAWLFFAFQPCFTYSANLDSNGSVYAWSTFNRPIKALFPGDPSWFSPPYTTFSTALVILGLSAAFGGPWVERRGPRAAATAAAIFFGVGLVLGGIGLAIKQSWLVFVGMGLVGGMGC